MGNTNVLATLQGYLVDQGKGINVPPTISAQFGPAIGTIIGEIFSGSIQLDGAAFSLSGTEAIATVQGTGSAAPLLQQIQVTAKFTAQASGVQLLFSAVIESNWPLSNAWPSVLNQYPFNQLTLASGHLALTANPGDQSFELDVSGTANLGNTSLGTGLLVVSYSDQKLGFVAGFVASGNWKPFANWPVLSNLTLSGEAGAFLSTITETDLSAFKSLNLPYLPSQVDPGLTFIAALKLTGALRAIESILPFYTVGGGGAIRNSGGVLPNSRACVRLRHGIARHSNPAQPLQDQELSIGTSSNPIRCRAHCGVEAARG